MKRNHSDKELSQLQLIKKENEKLKRQILQLRKQLARTDLDKYSNLKDTIEKHCQEDKAQEGQELLERLKQEWKCRDCENGYLEIILYNKLNNTWYFRKCNECSNRTAAQKYTSDVKGIVKPQKTMT
jgi:HPt (histidine-containing phosphotransfer) domain-containing protein